MSVIPFQVFAFMDVVILVIIFKKKTKIKSEESIVPHPHLSKARNKASMGVAVILLYKVVGYFVSLFIKISTTT